MERGKLYIVPTPIGNLEDITLRAIRILKEVDLILAEDTRNTSFLCKHYQIDTPIQSYHKDNEHKITERIIANLQNNQQFALVSDAGTPGISDPGFLLVRSCIANAISVECLPGATACIPALVNSGFPTDKFVFEGFLPHQKGRQKRLQLLSTEQRTIVLYESPYRILKLLNEIQIYFGAYRRVAISRELTKKFEEVVRGTVEEAILHFNTKEPKGEFVVVIEAAN